MSPIGSTRAGVRGLPLDAIPENGVARYYAPSLNFSGGESVDSWADEWNDNTITGSGPTYVDNAINSQPAVQFDEPANDFLSNSSVTLSQPFTFMAVVNSTGSSSNDAFWVVTADNTPESALFQGFNSDNAIITRDSGAEVLGTEASLDTTFLLTGVFDGSNSTLRENGTEVNSGTLETLQLDGLRLGNGLDFDGDRVGDIGEVRVFNDVLTSEQIDTQEEEMANDWGIEI